LLIANTYNMVSAAKLHGCRAQLQNMSKYLKSLIYMLLGGILLFACTEKEFNPDDPAGSFAIAREPYDDGNYEIALSKLGEFKTRFPYSQFAANAELLIANSHFELGQYDEAAITYEQFVKLHPKHDQIDFAMFRIGECYWSEAPEQVDRDQDLTVKALDAWQRLMDQRPQSEYSKKAKEFLDEGRLRIAKSLEFIVKFYCKQEIYHACATRALELAEKYPQMKEMRNEALKLAADSLEQVARQKETNSESDKNLYLNNLSAAEIRAKADAARKLIQ
jgi:outer membrane protein assembly factor BamD